MSEYDRLAMAEAGFREAVQQEQAALMTSGVPRAEATEILLRRLRGQGDGRSSTRSTTSHTRQSPPPTATFPTSMEDVDASSENDCHMGVAGETEGVDFREPPPGYSPAELDALVNIHGYSPEDAAKALTICDEMRRLEAAGVGGVAAAEELTRRVLCGRSAAVNPEESRTAMDSSYRGQGQEHQHVGVSGNAGGNPKHEWIDTERREKPTRDRAMPVSAGLRSNSRPGPEEADERIAVVGSSSVGKSNTMAASTPSPLAATKAAAGGGGGSSTRFGGRKRQHSSMTQEYHHHSSRGTHQAGGTEEGTFPPPFPPRPVTAAPLSTQTSRISASVAESCNARIGQEKRYSGCSKGNGAVSPSCSAPESCPISTGFSRIHGRRRGEEGRRVGSSSSSDGVSLQVPSPLGPSFPAAKRQRFANEGGGDDDKDGSGKDSPPRLVFVEPSQAKAVEGEGRQEEQEQQLQLAFHQLGVRQRNAPPSPPLVSVMPPKRPRNPGDDPPHGKRPRKG